MPASPVRRSARTRRPATTFYDEAAEEELKRRRSLEQQEKKRGRSSREETEESDSDDDEDFVVAKSPSRKKASKTKANSSKRSPVIVKRGNARVSPSKPANRRAATVASKRAFTGSRITQALTMLSKKVLNNHGDEDSEDYNDVMEDEHPKNSLFAALLASAKPIQGISSTERPKRFFYQQQKEQHLKAAGDDSLLSASEKRYDTIVSLCLPQLDGIIRELIASTELKGPHELHVKLLNLLFRSVGGSTRTNIREGTDLDELEDNDWDDLISKVVTVMKNESTAEQTVLVVEDDDDDEDGELSTISPPTFTTRKIGILSFRTLYKEFWYRLGHILLSHSPSQAAAMVSEDDDSDSHDMDSDDSDSDAPNLRAKKATAKTTKKVPPVTQGFSSNRFQLEKVRDLILRVTELVSVGQPDLRAAATIAVLQLAKACIERTVELEQKIKVASRQLKVASRAGSRQKQQALQHHLDNWKRHKAELEEIVEGPVIQGVFIHRYRDANHRIRRDCLRVMSELSLIRPDIFLVDTYLKYLGWMVSDKSASVRIAALEGLMAPFRASGWSESGKAPFPIDIQAMHNVLFKFLNRIVDCTDDAESTRVQEIAVRLMLYMLREEFLDEWEDDIAWDKVNLKALDALSSPNVRKDALYFIMDQLDTFDTTDEEKIVVSEQKQLDRLVAIARWCANKLCDGFIPIDKLNIELVDCIVHSLLAMPEHRDLVLNWPMIFRAIRSEKPQQGSENEREELATQRILLRVLATSAEIELRKATSESEENDSGRVTVSRKRKKSSSSGNDNSLDQLSTALLKNLSYLLDIFKSDVVSLRDVCKLPLAITSTALGLPSRKADFQNLVKTLCQLYLDSTDEKVLQHIAQTLSQWVEGDHTRVSEVKVNLKRLSGELQGRLMNLFRESDPQQRNEDDVKSKSSTRRRSKKRRRSSRKDGDSTTGGSTMFSTSPEADLEYSVALLMLRWKILLMQCQSKFLFEKGDLEDDNEEEEGEALFFTISEAMGKRLFERMPTRDRDTSDDATAVTTPVIWTEEDPDVHEATAKTIEWSLKVLLLILAYQLNDTLMDRKQFEKSGKYPNDIEIDEYNFPVLKMRKNLVKLLGLCFDQHLPILEGVEYTEEQDDFASSVQSIAGEVTSDLRTLFPWDWSKAVDPVRRELALTSGEDFTLLLSGFARWFQSREENSGEADDEPLEKALVREAILPLARVTNMNFDGFFRKEAAMIMQHINGSGSMASQTIVALSRSLKKTNPVRMLESQMACLRLAFENWLENEPYLANETSPTEEEMQEFEEAEKIHLDTFVSMEQVASKLSSTLGVAGRLSNDSLKKSILGFMREGIRYSFDGVEGRPDDDDLMVGSRLAFLSILTKYSVWVKREQDYLEQLSDYLIIKESELRRHPEFSEVHEDDLATLSDFKKSLGMRRVVEKVSPDGDRASLANNQSLSIESPSTPASGISSTSRRLSSAASRGSRRSGVSVQSELSPLYEEDTDNLVNDQDASPIPQKRRKTKPPSQTSREAIQEEIEDESSRELGDDTE